MKSELNVYLVKGINEKMRREQCRTEERLSVKKFTEVFFISFIVWSFFTDLFVKDKGSNQILASFMIRFVPNFRLVAARFFVRLTFLLL